VGLENETPHYALGVDIGGTKIAAAIVSTEGVAQSITRAPTPHSGDPQDILQAVAEVCRQLLDIAQANGQTVHAIGLGTAGQVNVDEGRVTYAVETLKNWTGTLVAQELQQRLSLPVVVDNDVNVMAAGEAQFGAGRGFKDGLCVAIGTGIGGALIWNGQLYRGAHWSAGEIGHTLVDWRGERPCTCGQRGHLEAYAAGPAMARQYCRLSGVTEHTNLRLVAQLAHMGDPLAQRAIAEGASLLGVTLNGMCNLLDPEVLVIGGGVAELGAEWWQPFETALRAGVMPAPQQVTLKRAELGVNAPLIGAAWLALQHPKGS
jgi:glucokinase